MKNFISIELAALLKKGVVMTQQNNLKVLLAFAAIYLIWGSTYLALRIGVETVPPFFLSALRFTFAGVLLYIWCLWKGEEQPDFSSLKKMQYAEFLCYLAAQVRLHGQNNIYQAASQRSLLHQCHSGLSCLTKNNGHFIFPINFFSLV
jgi:hypothetical protein